MTKYEKMYGVTWGLSHIDHACLDLLMNWEKQHKATGGSLVIDWESLTAKFHEFGKNNGKNSRPATIAKSSEAGNGSAKVADGIGMDAPKWGAPGAGARRWTEVFP